MGAQYQTKRPGDLNLEFNGGKVTVNPTDNDEFVTDVKQTADGKILVLSRAVVPGGFNLSQFTAQGILDSSFANGFFNDPDFPDRDALHVLEDGSFLVCGGAHTERLSVTRFHANGTLDTSYGVGGHAIVIVSELQIYGRKGGSIKALAPSPLQGLPPKTGGSFNVPDGNSLYVVFTVGWGGYDTLMTVAVRLDRQGNLDKTFNGSGYVAVKLAGPGIPYNFASAAILQTESGQASKLVILVTETKPTPVSDDGSRFLLRYDAQGQQDYRFGGVGNDQGLVRLDPLDFYTVSTVWADETGALRVIGSSIKDNLIIVGLKGAIRGYTARGEPDVSLNNGQLLLTEIAPSYGNWHDGVFYGQGGDMRMVLATSIPGDGPRIGVVQLLNDGVFDKTFGDDGRVALEAVQSGWAVNAQVRLLPNKDIILGYRNNVWWLLGGDAE